MYKEFIRLIYAWLIPAIWIVWWSFWLFSSRNVRSTSGKESPMSRRIHLSLVGLAIAMGFGSAEQHSRWADISLIWLISPMLIVALLFLVILAGLTYGLIVLIQILPPYARQVQDFFVLLSIQVGKLGDKLVDPVLRIRAFTASFKTLTRNLRWRL